MMDGLYEVPHVTSEVSDLEARNPYVSIKKPENEIKKNKIPRIYIVLAVIGVLLLIFIVIVAWKLVSLENTLSEERRARANENMNIRLLFETPLNGSNPNHKLFAFHAVITLFPNVSIGSTMVFDRVLLNKGNGYSNSTGIYRTPPGGEGWYYFSTFMTTDEYQYSDFYIVVNDEQLCTALGDPNSGLVNPGTQASCSAVVHLNEGDEVKVVYVEGSDNSPLWNIIHPYYHNGFNGFRISRF